MKNDRQKTIEEIIISRPVSTQEELSALLKERGFDATQATVSRDIKELRLVKTTGKDGETRYARPRSDSGSAEGKFNTIFRESVISVATAGNIVVLRCYTGMGNAACAALDSMEMRHIVGTIAGDDTIFAAVDTADDAASLVQMLQQILK